MSVRVRWAIIGVALAIVLGVVALYLFNTNLTMSTEEDRGPKTWVVQPGETLHVPADDVLLDDSWECPGKGGSTVTPRPGTGVDHSSGFRMSVDMDGNVTAYCEPGPPGDH